MSEPLCYNVLQIYNLNMIIQNFYAVLKHFLFEKHSFFNLKHRLNIFFDIYLAISIVTFPQLVILIDKE